MALSQIALPSVSEPWFDPATGRPTPEFARALAQIVAVIAALRTSAGV